jgi:tetratricopeptide (TPR) repeat protein
LGNLAMYADWDFRLADRELALAMQNDPTYFDAVSGYFDLLLILGRTAEAGHVLEQALALRPATASLRLERALLFYLDSRWDDCIAETTVAGTLDPMDTRAPWQRGLCQEGKRDFPMAESEYRKCLSVSPHDLRAETALGHLLGRTGKREEALAIAHSIEREAAQGKPAAYRLALVWNGLGDRNRALDWLERAVASRDRSAIYLKIERRLEDLHSEPRFLALVRQMGLGPVR